MAKSPTEERVNLRRFEDDVLPHSLPGMRPPRTKEQAEGELAIYRKLVRVSRALAAHLWDVLQLPGKSRPLATERPWEAWTPREQAEFARAVEWLRTAILGPARDPKAYSIPSNAELDVDLPIWHGRPILPGELRTAYTTGAERAAALLGNDAPALLGIRSEAAKEDLLVRGFERLSDGARVKLADVLTAEGYPGGSVRDLLDASLAEGKNPLVVAKELRQKFGDMEGYQWPRLARTEISFAQNHAARDEYHEAGYRVPTLADGGEIDLPPYHPNCCCSSTIDPLTGWIMPDVALTACELCQAALMDALLVTADSPAGQVPQDGGEAAGQTAMPITFDTTGEAEAWAAERHPEIAWDLKGATPELAGKAVVEFDNMLRQYPWAAKSLHRVQVVPAKDMKGSPFAAFKPDGGVNAIRLNRAYWSNPEKFQRMLDKGVETRTISMPDGTSIVRSFHPVGTNKPEAVVTHEFGHVVGEAAAGAAKSGRIAKELHPERFAADARLRGASAVSDYANENLDEAFASTFDALHNSPEGTYKTVTDKMAEYLQTLGEKL